MKTLEEALRNIQKETAAEEKLYESQSQEIADSYRKLSKLYGVDVEKLVYGPEGFMASRYPDGFDVSADIIFLEDKWNEFERWVKETKGVDFEAIRQQENTDTLIEAVNDNHEYLLQVSVMSGINADGVDISVLQSDKVIKKAPYRYGYNASYSKSSDPSTPHIKDIIQDYILKYNITEDNFTVIAGRNVFKGDKVCDADVDYFKKSYCIDLVFSTGAESVTEAKITEVAGGKSLGLTIEDIAKKHNITPEKIEAQIKIGVEIEKEHSDDAEEAKKVAMDHLVEFPDYYDRLVKMEKEAKGEVKEDIDYEKLKKQIDSQPITPVKKADIWNPDLYLKKEQGYEEAINTVRKVLKNSSLTPEEITLSVYGSVIMFDKNAKLDADQMKMFVDKVLAKINPSLKAERFRSMTGKVTFDITGYEYLKDYITDENEELLNETYTDDELDDMIGDVYNIQKIDNIYRRKKYDDKRLFAHTVCVNCGRDKTVFLANLINDPDKYGSCICSDTNIEAKIDNIQQLYSGNKKLKSNTSGYTGVSFVKTYKGEPYNKWRAYIEVDGVRTYLGDFTSKAKAIKARKEAGEKGIKWYKDNRNKLMRDVRRRSKKYKTSKYRETQKARTYAKVK